MQRLSLRLETIVLSALFLGGLACAYRMWMRTESITTESGLSVTSESLDFGDVWAQEAFVWSLPLYNETSSDIEITDFDVSCHCTSISPNSLIVPAYGEALVHVTMDLRPMFSEQAMQSDRPFAVLIAARTAGRSRSDFGWNLEGRIRNAVLVSPIKVDFQDRLVRGSPFSPATVELTCHPDCMGVTAECDSSIAKVNLMPRAGMTDFQLEIIPNAELTAGEHEFDVSLTPQSADGEEIPDMRIPVICRVWHDVEVVPRQIALGAQNSGESVDATAFLRSRTGKRFVVEDVIAPDNDITVTPSIDSDAGQLFRIVCPSVQPGLQNQQVRFIVSQQHEDEKFDVSLSVVYHGIEPAEHLATESAGAAAPP